MKNVSLEQLLAIIGAKEVELFLLRQEHEALRNRLSEAEAKLAEKPEAAQ